MKIDIISDLHLDFWCRETNPTHRNFEKQIDDFILKLGFKDSNSETLIIAGDLGHFNSQDQALLTKLKQIYTYIFLVRGNHDMYLISNSQKSKYLLDSKNRYLEMKRWCKENGIHYLDGNIVSVDGYNFAGCGMSWDSSYYNLLEKREASRGEITEFFNNTMNDSRLIYAGSDNYKIPTAYGASYFKSSFDPFKYFEDEYNKLQRINDYDNIDIMISHYIPMHSLIDPKYTDDLSSTFYCFDGHKDVQRINPKIWVFGHTHVGVDNTLENTRFICNPLGYPGERPFTIVQTIEI